MAQYQMSMDDYKLTLADLFLENRALAREIEFLRQQLNNQTTAKNEAQFIPDHADMVLANLKKA